MSRRLQDKELAKLPVLTPEQFAKKRAAEGLGAFPGSQQGEMLREQERGLTYKETDNPLAELRRRLLGPGRAYALHARVQRKVPGALAEAEKITGLQAGPIVAAPYTAATKEQQQGTAKPALPAEPKTPNTAASAVPPSSPVQTSTLALDNGQQVVRIVKKEPSSTARTMYSVPGKGILTADGAPKGGTFTVLPAKEFAQLLNGSATRPEGETEASAAGARTARTSGLSYTPPSAWALETAARNARVEADAINDLERARALNHHYKFKPLNPIEEAAKARAQLIEEARARAGLPEQAAVEAARIKSAARQASAQNKLAFEEYKSRLKQAAEARKEQRALAQEQLKALDEFANQYEQGPHVKSLVRRYAPLLGFSGAQALLQEVLAENPKATGAQLNRLVQQRVQAIEAQQKGQEPR